MDLYALFIKPYETYTSFQIFLEVLATFFGLLSVYFSINRNILVYPSGIISTSIYVYILFKFGLWGDMLINFYYTLMSTYGWVLWNKNSSHKKITVSFAKKKDWAIGSILFVLSLVAVSMIYYFKPLFDNDLQIQEAKLGFEHLDWTNWLDVLTTALFLVGMWFMAQQKIENWFFWIIGDIICIPMMIYKGLGITSFQFLIFTIMAIIGYTKWKQNSKNTLSKL